MQHVLRRAGLVLCAAAAVLAAVQLAPVGADAGFGDTIARLSEPGGSFDTDNLISNESSYLEVIPDLVARGASGGAYIGVGPDQNFSYIARVRPSVLPEGRTPVRPTRLIPEFSQCAHMPVE